MEELGNAVLSKIQHILTDMRRKDTNKSQKIKEQQKSTIELISRERLNKEDISPKISTRRSKRANLLENRKKEQLYEQAKEYEPYRVKNHRTFEIISKSPHRPIHERVPEILKKKKSAIESLRRQIDSEEQQVDAKKPKMSKNQLQDFICNLDDRNKDRNYRKNAYKLQFLKKEVFNGIPCVNKSSDSLCNQRKLKKNHSDNVFVRLQQQCEDKYRKHHEYVKQRQSEETPFQPLILSYSRVRLAQRSMNFEKINRSQSQIGKSTKEIHLIKS